MNKSKFETSVTLSEMESPGPAPTDPPTPPLNPEAQAALAEEVRIFKAHLAAASDCFRRMLHLARHYQLTPPDFYSHLRRAGLKTSRCSELKQVLAAKEQCDALLGESRQPWKLTVSLSRLYRIEKEFGLTAPDLLAGRVAGLLFKNGVACLVVAGGLLTLASRPADLHAVSVTST